MVNEYNGRKKSTANMLSLNKLHSRSNPIFLDVEKEDSQPEEEASLFAQQ